MGGSRNVGECGKGGIIRVTGMGGWQGGQREKVGGWQD